MTSNLSLRETARQAENRLIMLSALQALGIQQIKVRYGGKQNNCNYCHVSAHPFKQFSLLAEHQVTQYHGREGLASAPQEMSLLNALMTFALQWAELIHPNWTLGDGATGTMTIETTSRVFTLEHDVYITENLYYRLED